MTTQQLAVAAIFLIFSLEGRAADLPAPSTADCKLVQTPNQKKDEETIRRIEHNWLTAERQGNVQFLQCLLVPGYVNIAKDGTTRSATGLLASVAKNKGKNLEVPPIESVIVVSSDSATSYSTSKAHDKNGQLIDVHYVDSFMFIDGAWHAYCGVDL